jgi:hypothetical protein
MFASCPSNDSFGKRGQAINRERARLRAAVEADSASGAIVTRVVGGVYAVMIQLRSQFQALWRTGLDAQPASFALVGIY